MNPDISALMAAQQNTQPTAGAPASQGNPFMNLIQQAPSGGTGAPSAPQTSSQPSQQDSENPQEQSVPADMEEDQTQKGVNPGTSPYLLGAVQQLQKFIAESQDRDEIAIGRSIIQLLTRLIAQDQANQQNRL